MIFPGSDSGGFLFSWDLPPGSESATRHESSWPPPSRLNWGLFVFFCFFVKVNLLNFLRLLAIGANFGGSADESSWGGGWVVVSDGYWPTFAKFDVIFFVCKKNASLEKKWLFANLNISSNYGQFLGSADESLWAADIGLPSLFVVFFVRKKMTFCKI